MSDPAPSASALATPSANRSEAPAEAAPAWPTAPRIAFQGEPGAYSHQACRQARPEMEAVPCATFEEVIDLTRSGEVDLGRGALDLRLAARPLPEAPEVGLRRTGPAAAPQRVPELAPFLRWRAER